VQKRVKKTIYTSYDMLLQMQVHFVGRDVTAPHLGVKSPKKLHLGHEGFSSQTR